MSSEAADGLPGLAKVLFVGSVLRYCGVYRDEQKMLLEELAIQLLSEVRRRFTNYASEVHASRRPNGWASLRAGAVEKYVACFDSMAETLVRECLREKGHQPDALILLIMNVIEQAIRSSENVPTDPWMPEELFTDDKFRVAMTAMIEAKLKQLEPRLFREGRMRKADNQSHSSTRKTPAQILEEYKILKNLRTHELVAEDLGLERSVYFDLKTGKKVSEATYVKAALRIGCSPDDLKP